MTAKINALVEKLFILLLTGTCGFAVTYLRDITISLGSIRDKMSVACEQISAIDAGMKSIILRVAEQEVLIDKLHPRKGT